MHFVIGDIHGELTKLKNLVQAIFQQTKNPTFIFVGDYVDKGENSLATLEFLEQLKNQHPCHFLLGNHEYYWLNLDENALTRYGAITTVKDCGKTNFQETQGFLLQRFAEFFKHLKLSWENDQYLVTHSGLTPAAYQKKAADFTPEDVLFNRYDFLKNEQFYQGKQILFGHTGFYSLFYDGKKIGVDTSACYLREQPLTAFCLEEKYAINSNQEKYFAKTLLQEMRPTIPRVKPYRLKGL